MNSLECDLVLDFETYQDGDPVECVVTYMIHFDADPYAYGAQTVWNSWFEVDIQHLSFHYSKLKEITNPDGSTYLKRFDYIPTSQELRDWKDEINSAVQKDARKNAEKAA